MKSCLGANWNLATSLLDNFCKTHRSNKEKNIYTAYTSFCHAGIFDNYAIAELLLSIDDESYTYIFDEFNELPSQGVLLNLFSGSGRLIKEIANQGILNCFSCVYNVDSSQQMIEFEKEHFKIDGMQFLCEDILNISPRTIAYNLAVCHCGIRYVEPIYYSKLADILLKSKKDRTSRCILTEIDEKFVKLFMDVLIQKCIKFQSKKTFVRVQRNTTLYLAYIYYKTNLYFQDIVNNISFIHNKDVKAILQEISGYKMVNMNIILF